MPRTAARRLTPLILGSTLLLAACGDNDQTAQPPTDRAAGGERTAQSAAPQPAPPPIASTPQASTTPSAPSPAAPSGAPETTASIDRRAPAVSGKTFASSATTLQFNPDNTFSLREPSGQRAITGRYAFEGDQLTLSEPQGAAAAGFPMTCRVEMPSPTQLKIEESNGTCAMLSNQTFQQQGG